MNTKRKPERSIAMLLMGAVLTTASAQADVFTVTNTNDSGPGSLRENLVLASSDADHTILFDASLDGETITLTTGNLVTVRDPNTVLNIDASNLENGITIDADNASRHLVQIGDAARINITGMTFINGRGPDGGGNDGGSMNFAESIVTLVDCRFADNRAGDGSEINSGGGDGGAVYTKGSLFFSQSEFENNRAGDGYDSPDSEGGDGGDGGAIFALFACEGGASTFSDNRAGDGGSSATDGENAGAGGSGGAVYFNESSFFGIGQAVFSGNEAGNGGAHSGDGLGGSGGQGGALYIGNGVSLFQLKFVGNRAGHGGMSQSGRNGSGGHGGAIVHYGGNLIIQSAIFHQNQAGVPGLGFAGDPGTLSDGGAIFSLPIPAGQLALTNCIVSGNRETAIYLFGGDGVIQSSTIVGNFDPNQNDSAIVVGGDAELTIRNSILGGNTNGLNREISHREAFGEAEIILVGENFETDDVPVDLTPDPVGPDEHLFGVPLPGETEILDRLTMTDDTIPFQDIREGNRPFGLLADLGAVEAVYRPDQLIGKRNNEATMRGNDLFSVSGSGQRITVRPKGRRKKSAYLKVTNDGDLDDLTLRGKIKKRNLRVKVHRVTGRRANLTAAIAGSGHTAADIRNGEGETYRVRVKRTGRKSRVRKNLRFDLTSSSAHVGRDRSRLRVIAKK